MSAVVALCEAVTGLLGPTEWPLEEMAELLTAELQRQRSTVPILQILGLAVAATLELSRKKQNSTEPPISESTCETAGPSSEEIRVVAEAIWHSWDDPEVDDTPLSEVDAIERGLVYDTARAAIVALDRHREERRGG